MAVIHVAPLAGDVSSGYVAGNDANSGADAGNPKTLNGGYTAAAAGDTIVMAPGRFRANRNYTTTTATRGATQAAAIGSGAFALAAEKNGLTFTPLVAPTPAASIYDSGNPCSALWNPSVLIEGLRSHATGLTFSGLGFRNMYWPASTGRWVDTPIGDLVRSHFGFYGLLHIGLGGCTVDQCDFFGGYAGDANPATYPHGYGATFSDFNDTKTGDTQLSPYPDFRSTAYMKFNNSANWPVPNDPELIVTSDVVNGKPGFGMSRNGIDPAGIAAATAADAGYNSFFWSPVGVNVSNDAGATAAGFTCTRSSFRSLRSGINLGHQYSTANLLIDQIYFDRIYMDLMFLAGQETQALSPDKWEIFRIIGKMSFGDERDAGNAHGDGLQMMLGNVAANSKKYMNRIRAVRHFMYQTSTQRGFGQAHYIGTNSAKQKGNDTTFVRSYYSAENILSCNSNLGTNVSLIKHGAYFDRVVQISRARLDATTTAGCFNLESFSQNYNPGLAAEEQYLATISRSISEATVTYSPNNAVATRYSESTHTIIGRNGSARAFSSIFKGADGTGAGFGAGNASDAWGAKELFKAFQSKNAIADGGLDTTLEAFFETAIDWSSHRLSVGWARKINVAVNTLISFPGAPVNGGGAPGTTATVAPQAGVEVAVYDYTDTTNVSGWVAYPSTTTIQRGGDHLLRIRGTSSTFNSKTSEFGVLIDGQRFAASVRTVSAYAYPKTTLDGTQRVRYALATAGLAAADSSFATIVCKATPNAGTIFNGGTGKRLLDFNGGSTGIGLLNFGASSLQGGVYKAKWNFNLRNSANALVLNAAGSWGPYIAAGDATMIALSIDLTQPDMTTGLRAYLVDASGTWTAYTPAGGTYVAGGTVAWSKFVASAFLNLLADNTASPVGFQGDFEMMYVNDVYLDLSDPAVQDKFTVDNIGEKGEGPTGSAPLIFLTGKDSLLNADTKLGSTARTQSHNGTFGASSPATWPIPLNLDATVLTSAPYYVGAPIQILVQPVGTNNARTINSSNVGGAAGAFDFPSIAMPVASNGVVFTYTPSAAGSHNLTFTDSGGTPDYPDPTALAINVVVAPPAGLVSRLRSIGGMPLSLGM